MNETNSRAAMKALSTGYAQEIDQAMQLFESGRLGEAQKLCLRLMESPEHDGRARHIAGLVEIKRGAAGRAVEMLSQAVRERSSDPMVHNSLGEALRASGEPDQAEIHFRYALHLQISFCPAHFNLGLVLWERGHLEDACLSFKNALVIQPDFAEALRCLGRVNLELGNALAAKAHFTEAAQLRPDDAVTQMLLGECHWAIGETQDAWARHGAAAALEPANGAVQFNRALASFELCREEEALEHLSRALVSAARPDAVPGATAVASRLADIRMCLPADSIVRTARDQWHKVSGAPGVLSLNDEVTAPEALRTHTDEIFVARLSPGVVVPNELLAMDSGNRVFLDGLMSQPLERAYTSRFIMHASDDGRLLLALPGKKREIGTECVLLGAAASHFTWIFECLARLWVVRQQPRLEHLPLVVQSGLSQWQSELLSLCGYGANELIQLDDDAMISCSELHVPSLVTSGHFVAPGAVEYLRRTLRETVPVQPEARLRLYLARKRAETRRLANESEIEVILASNGFLVIDPSELGVVELLSLLQAAEVVIGVEGAAMAHLFFAPPRATVGMIVAENLQSTRYFGPSAVLGQDFTFLLAQADFSSHALHNECDLRLEPALLQRFLSTA